MITRPETFELIKELQEKYCKRTIYDISIYDSIYFDVLLCDNKDESRAALFDYLKWVIRDTESYEREDYLSLLFHDVTNTDVSDKMLEMLRDLFNEYPINFRNKQLNDKIFGT